jgi:hypothetical protein
MMFRTLIREDTARRLAAMGRWHRVFNARQPVTTRDDLPYIKVWTPDDGGDRINIRSGLYHARPMCSLNVQVVIEGVVDEDNARLIDDMCEAVLHGLLEDPVWIMQFNQVSSVNTSIESNTEGEARTVQANIIFAIEYEEIYQPRIIDDLDRLQVTVPVPGQPDGVPGNGNVVQVPIEFKAPGIGHHRARDLRGPGKRGMVH